MPRPFTITEPAHFLWAVLSHITPDLTLEAPTLEGMRWVSALQGTACLYKMAGLEPPPLLTILEMIFNATLLQPHLIMLSTRSLLQEGVSTGEDEEEMRDFTAVVLANQARAAKGAMTITLDRLYGGKEDEDND